MSIQKPLVFQFLVPVSMSPGHVLSPVPKVFSFFKSIFSICSCICMRVQCGTVSAHECRCLQRPEVSDPPGARVIGSCEPHGVGVGN